MFQVYRCSYCEFMGQDRMVEKHEKDCPHNSLNHSCHTCAYRKGLGFAKFGCQKNVIFSGNYKLRCSEWNKDKTDWSHIPDDPFEVFFGSSGRKE